MSRLRLVATLDGGAVPGESVKVYRDVEWDEFRVVLCYDGGKPSRFTYHTDTKADALATGRAMLGVGTEAANAGDPAMVAAYESTTTGV